MGNSESVNVNITENNTYNVEVKNAEALKKAQADFAEADARAKDFEDQLKKVRDELAQLKGSDVGVLTARIKELEEQISQFAERSVAEFNTFLRSVRLIEQDESVNEFDLKFGSLVESLKSGAITASEAIARVKSEYDYLLQELMGEGIDGQQFQVISTALTSMSDRLDEVITKLAGLAGGGGGGAEAVEEFGAAAESASGASKNFAGSVGSVEQVLARLEQMAQKASGDIRGAYESISELVKALYALGGIDGANLYNLGNVFKNIGGISSKVSLKSVENITLLARKLYELNQAGIAGSLRFDIAGLEGVRIPRASIEALANNLPGLAKASQQLARNTANFEAAAQNIRTLASAISELQPKVTSNAITSLEKAFGNLGKNTPKNPENISAVADALKKLQSLNTAKLQEVAKLKFPNLTNIKINAGVANKVAQLADALKLLEQARVATINASNKGVEINPVKTSLSEAKHIASEYYKAQLQIRELGDNIVSKDGQYAAATPAYEQRAAAINAAVSAYQRLISAEGMENMQLADARKFAEYNAEAQRKYNAEVERRVQAETQQGAAEEQRAAGLAAIHEAEMALTEDQRRGNTAIQDRINAMVGIDRETKSAAESARFFSEQIKQEDTQVRTAAQAAKEEYNVLLQNANLRARAASALKNYSAAQNSSNTESREAYSALQRAAVAAEDARKSYDHTAESVNRIKDANQNLKMVYAESTATLKTNGDAARSVFTLLGAQFKKLSVYFGPMRIIMQTVRMIREMIKASRELDLALGQMQIVTRESDEAIAKFGESAAKTAKEIGSSITDVVESATTFARLGYSSEESGLLAKYTAMLKNVADIEVGDAQSAITSIIKAFDDVNVDTIEDTMNKLVVTGNNFPISVSEIAEGMRNASSTLAAAGNSFEQSVALLTAANTTMQNASKASTGLRTIAARIRNTKTDLEELGEDMTVSAYDEIVKQLTDLDVSLKDANGEYRSTYDIMADIAAKWKDMSSMQRSALATALSGTRQQAVFYSIIEQFQEASGSLDAMLNGSSGALTSAYDTYLGTTEAHIGRLKASFQELGSDLFDSSLMNAFVDAANGLTMFLDTLAKAPLVFTAFIGSLGGTIISLKMAKSAMNMQAELEIAQRNAQGAATAFTQETASVEALTAQVTSLTVQEKGLARAQIEREIVTGKISDAERQLLTARMLSTGLYTQEEAVASWYASSIMKQAVAKGIVTGAEKTYTAAQQEAINKLISETVAVNGLGNEMRDLIAQMLAGAAGTEVFSASAKKASFSFGAMWAAMPVPGKIMMVFTIITTVVGAIKTLVDQVDTAEEKFKAATEKSGQIAGEMNQVASKFKQASDSVSEIAPKLVELSRGVDQFGNNVSLSEDKYEEFLGLNNQLAEIFPDLKIGMDSNGNAMLNLSYNADTLTASLEELIKTERSLANQKIVENLPELFENTIVEGDKNSAATRLYEPILNVLERAKENAFKEPFASKPLSEGGDYGLLARFREAGNNSWLKTYTSLYDEYIAAGKTMADLLSDSRFNNLITQVEKAVGQLRESDKVVNRALSSWLETDFSFSSLGSERQSIAQRIVASLDIRELYRNGYNTSEKVQAYITDSIITPLMNASDEVDDIITEMFDVDEDLQADEFARKIFDLSSKVYNMTGITSKQIRDALGFSDIIDEIPKMRSEIFNALSPSSKAVFGNVDMNNRPEIWWTKKVADHWRYELSTLGEDADEMIGDVSTVLSQWDTFKYGGKEINIAFTPILKKEDGSAEILTSDEIGKYIDEIVRRANGDADAIIELDAKGIDVASRKVRGYVEGLRVGEFKHIGGIIADVGDTAAKTSEEMHNFGNKGLFDHWLQSLSVAELRKVSEYIRKYGVSSFEDVKQALKDGTIEALNFTLSIENEEEGIESLTDALKESGEAAGLSAKSIETLRQRYAGLSAEGYNVDDVFRRTANGIRVNRDAVMALERAYAQSKSDEQAKKLEALRAQYNKLNVEIANATTASEQLDLARKQSGILDEIRDTAVLASNYAALTSAYSEWQKAKETPDSFDIYENVAKGYDEVGELLSRGIYNKDDVNSYLNLILGTDRIKDNAEAWNSLAKEIGSSGFSILDFFKFDNPEDGRGSSKELTSKGLKNFFSTVENELGPDYVRTLEDGSVWWDFTGKKIDEVSKKLGISTELIEIFTEAMTDVSGAVTVGDAINDAFEGLDVTIKDSYESFEAFKDDIFGRFNIQLDIDTNSAKSLDRQLRDLGQVMSDEKNGFMKNGLIDFNVSGASEIMNTMAFISQRLREMNHPNEINISTESLQDADVEVQRVVGIINDGKDALSKYDMNAALGDTDKADRELQTIARTLSTLDVDTKAKLGLDTEDAKAAIKEISSVDLTVDGATIPEDAREKLETALFGITKDQYIELGVKIDDENAVDITVGKNEVQEFYDWWEDADLSKNAQITPVWAAVRRAIAFIQNADLNKTVTITTSASGSSGKFAGPTPQARAQGTAYDSGDWRIGGDGIALVGEVGPELVVRNGRYFTIGNSGAEMFRYRHGDIIFNAEQTRQILRNGRILNGKKRGISYLDGTAFSTTNTGTAKFDQTINYSPIGTIPKSSSSKGSSSSSSAKDSAEDTVEAIDWIEIAISRVERAIDNLGKVASSAYRTLGKRLGASSSEISEVTREIDLQQKAYDRYIKQANSVGLSSGLAQLVRDGAIDITKYDEDTRKLIDDYKEWYEKALACKDAVDDLHESLADLYKDRFDEIEKDFDNRLSLLEHQTNMYDASIEEMETSGYFVASKYYRLLKGTAEASVTVMQSKAASLRKALEEAMDSGEIEEYSEAWYEMVVAINEVDEATAEAATKAIEYARAIRQLKWDINEFRNDQVDRLAGENDFLIGLLETEKLFTETGKLTSQGLATLGAHTVSYNVYMKKALDYAGELRDVQADLAKDPNDKDAIETFNDLVDAQRDAIESALDERDAIKSLVEDGIEKELESVKKLIDAYEDELDRQKDIYEYQKKIADKTREVASIRKQLAAFSGDESDESRARIQKLQLSLRDAEDELREEEYDQYISDQKQILDDMYEEYEKVLNARLDDMSKLIEDVCDAINANADTVSGTIANIPVADDIMSIRDTLQDISKQFGYIMSPDQGVIWNAMGRAVVEAFTSASLSKALEANKELGDLNADGKITAAEARKVLRASAKLEQLTEEEMRRADLNKDGKITAAEARAILRASAKLDGLSAAPTTTVDTVKGIRDSVTSIADSTSHMATAADKLLEKGVTGAPKFASGGLADFTGLAHLDGSKQHPELVLNPQDTQNFIALRDGLRQIVSGAVFSPIDNLSASMYAFRKISDRMPSGVSNSFGNININIDHVEDYDDFVTKLQSDRNFERMIQAMTVDRAVGGGALNKYRYSW